MSLREGLRKIISSKSKTFLAFCFCFLAGVALSSLLNLSQKYLFIVFCLSLSTLFLIALFWQNNERRLYSLCVLFFSIGVIRYLVFLPNAIDPGHITSHLGQDIVMDVSIAEEPSIKDTYNEYVVKNFQHNGNFLLQLPQYTEYGVGDRLAISCRLSSPDESSGRDRYAKYLEVRNIWAICQKAKILGAGDRDISFYQYIFLFKSHISRRVIELWPEPGASLVGGLLYGDRSGLPKDLADSFNRTGISHIVAVSGYNISIIAAALMIILIIIGLYRQQAFWLAIIGIALFVVFTGASSSAVRAGLMGAVVLLGNYLGRPSRAAPALVFAAVLMVFFNPLVLIWDVGFQLSFVATAGILYLAAPIEQKLSRIINRFFKTTQSHENPGMVATTSAAIIATLPLVLYYFGRLSLVALPVNLLVLWLIPYIMLFGFLSILASFIFFSLGEVVAWIVGVGLNYIISVTEFFAQWKWSSAEFSLPWPIMLLAYMLLIYFFIWQNKKSR